jgi:hypothetical protein
LLALRNNDDNDNNDNNKDYLIWFANNGSLALSRLCRRFSGPTNTAAAAAAAAAAANAVKEKL